MSEATRRLVIDYMLNQRPDKESFAGFQDALRRHEAALRAEGYGQAKEQAAKQADTFAATCKSWYADSEERTAHAIATAIRAMEPKP